MRDYTRTTRVRMTFRQILWRGILDLLFSDTISPTFRKGQEPVVESFTRFTHPALGLELERSLEDI